MAADTEGPSGNPGETPRGKSAGPGPSAGLVAFTLDPASGRIVKVESVDASGARRELTREEKAALARRNGKSTLEDILEQTFEAGISSVLTDEAEEPDLPESEEEAALRRMILRPMMERSAVSRLLKREVLGRAIVATLIRQTGGLHEADIEKSPEKGAGPSRRSPSSGAARRSAPRGRTQH